MATKIQNAPAGDVVNGLIARRIAQLRKARNLSFDALATRADLSKGILVAIEQGQANPSIGTLCKLAATLGVSLTDLLAEEPTTSSAVRVVTPEKASVLWQGAKGGTATLLVGVSGPDMLELWDWSLAPGEVFQSKGHPPGTLELLAVREGELALDAEAIEHVVAAGHCAIVQADRAHAYRCRGRKRVRFSMVVQEPAQKAGRGSEDS